MEKAMSVDALWSPERQQETSAQAAALQQPPDCPLALCAAIERGQKELERLNRTEAKLREALAREKVLLDEKDELIRHKDLMNLESDHRLMNGLQMVSSLLSLQSHEAQNTKTAEQLKIAANRVATIGSVHKRLHALDHVRSVELKQYLENLCQDIRGILPAEADHNLAVEGIALEVPTAIGIPLGYIVSELVTNSAKYAKGKITVRLDRNPGEGYELSVSDDGPGFPEGFDPKKSKGLGMKIVSSLINQIDGQSLFGPNHLGGGARFMVLFALNERAAKPTGMRTCTKMAREQYVVRSMQHWHIVKIDADGKETVVGITDSERDAKAEAARLEREAEHTEQTRNT
jgi:two-component system, sensor histidine kinase PdtaS